MDFKVLIAESAIADLKEIVEFVAQDDSSTAIKVGEKPIEHAMRLARRKLAHMRNRGVKPVDFR